MKIIDTFHRLIGRGMPVPDSAVIPCGIISPEVDEGCCRKL